MSTFENAELRSLLSAVDGDGGYRAAERARAFVECLQPLAQRVAATEFLLSLIEKHDLLSGVALETIAGIPDWPFAQDGLFRLFTHERKFEKKQEIARSLMRMCASQYRAELLRFTNEVCKKSKVGALVLASALALVDRQGSVACVADLWCRLDQLGKREAFEECTGALVLNYADVDWELLLELLRLVRADCGADSFSRLREALLKYLTQPWTMRKLGDQVALAIRAC